MSTVRIIKNGAAKNQRALKPTDDRADARQTTRDVVSTVKQWIADLEQRHRAEERASAALIR